MNLYEFEGKKIFSKYGIKTPTSVLVRRQDDVKKKYRELDIKDVIIKAQILSGKRGKNNGIVFASNLEEVESACDKLFLNTIRNQYVAAILIEQRIDIKEEQYLSITYDTNRQQPVLVYSTEGGMDIEDVDDKYIEKHHLDIRDEKIDIDIPYANELWKCFLTEDARLLEINPLVLVKEDEYYAVDSKIALDSDAFFRHDDWKVFEPRAMLGRTPTKREIEVEEIDKGDNYYRGTAGKYIEMDGDVAVLFSGGGASISNMDALTKNDLKPANYTEYSGNPPQEKVYELSKIVLSKPDLKGLWIAGGVANFTDIAATFKGIIQALDEVKPNYPIVVRRAGPHEEEARKLLEECAKRNKLDIKVFGKEVSMSKTAKELADMINK